MKIYLVIFFTASLGLQAQNPDIKFPRINPENIEIIRDEWGLAHVFTKTDAEAAYGLAWVNAEDDFETVQEIVNISRGVMGLVQGADGAKIDYLGHAIGAEKIVKEKYESELSWSTKKYVNGYVQGINAYAAAHPQDVILKKAFPITSYDLLKGYVISQAFLSGVSGEVERIVEGNFKESYESVTDEEYHNENEPVGSNAFAFKASKTIDGKTYLCANPHWRLEEMFSFYEVHLCSEEGLNFHGILFHGAANIFMGTNPNMGWGMTYNYFDKGDVYRLVMHPKKMQYTIDNQWYNLEKRPVWLKVKFGPIVLPVPQKTYWSHLGPVIKSKDGHFYAIKYPSLETIITVEQLLEMNKATNFNEWHTALQKQGLNMFNIVYADKDDNIFYISNGQYPKRNMKYYFKDWATAGNSDVIWKDLIPTEELPQNYNPTCAYVFNTNNNPFHSSDSICFDDQNRLPHYVSSRNGNNNRAMRFWELVSEKDQFSFEDFKKIKFDYQYPKNGKFIESLEEAYKVNPDSYPHIKDEIVAFQNWDRVADTNSTNATIALFALSHIFDKNKYGDNVFQTGIELTEADFIAAIEWTKNHMIRYFGSTVIPLKQVFRLVRGERETYATGFPDALMASYAIPYKDGKLKLLFGDSFSMFAKYGKNGLEQLETQTPFGVSCDPNSPHYFDQVKLYQNMDTKKMSLDRAKILNRAMERYHPK